jgi:hypothetical protein
LDRPTTDRHGAQPTQTGGDAVATLLRQIAVAWLIGANELFSVILMRQSPLSLVVFSVGLFLLQLTFSRFHSSLHSPTTNPIIPQQNYTTTTFAPINRPCHSTDKMPGAAIPSSPTYGKILFLDSDRR